MTARRAVRRRRPARARGAPRSAARTSLRALRRARPLARAGRGGAGAAARAAAAGRTCRPGRVPSLLGAALAVARGCRRWLGLRRAIAARARRRRRSLQVVGGPACSSPLLATLTGGRGQPVRAVLRAGVLSAGIVLARRPAACSSRPRAACAATSPCRPSPARLRRGGGRAAAEPVLPGPSLVAFLAHRRRAGRGRWASAVRRTRRRPERTRARAGPGARSTTTSSCEHLASGVLTVDARGTVAHLNPAGRAGAGPARRRRCAAGACDEAFPERLRPLLERCRRRSARGRRAVARRAHGADAAGGRGAARASTTTSCTDEDGACRGVIAVFPTSPKARRGAARPAHRDAGRDRRSWRPASRTRSATASTRSRARSSSCSGSCKLEGENARAHGPHRAGVRAAQPLRRPTCWTTRASATWSPEPLDLGEHSRRTLLRRWRGATRAARPEIARGAARPPASRMRRAPDREQFRQVLAEPGAATPGGDGRRTAP